MLDLALTLLILPFAFVLGAIIAVLILVDSPGPILYRSRRIGKDGRPFSMLKFRKMRREASGLSLTRLEDDRLTPIGRFLFVTKLDELPQLWNVLRGQMRLVGPRPEVEEFVDHFGQQYDEILSVLPGVTGPAQLDYAEERRLLGHAHEPAAAYTEMILPRKIAVDLEYIRARSLGGDLALLLRTAVLPIRALRARFGLVMGDLAPGMVVSYAIVLMCVLALVGAFAAEA